MADGDASSSTRHDRFLSIPALAVVLVVYVALGVVLKSFVLNWIVGPFFPVAVLYVAPRLLRRRAR